MFKGGRKDRQDAMNYRPISLTSCVARVMEKLLNKQVLKYLRGNSLLSDRSTVTQLCLLRHRWQLALDKRDSIETAFLDLSKAYDRVTIPWLIYKLSLYGFSRAAIDWFSAFLTNRQQHT